MRFGLALDFMTAERTLAEQLDRYVPLIQVAERHGFDSVTAGEGYIARPASGHLPAPLLALAALAPRTGLRLGTGVTLLPGWHPLRLAYEAAVLDQISGGRLILGVGLGTPPLYRRFGWDPARMADFADDMLGALRALWAGEDGFEGKYLTVQGSVGVRPIRPQGPVVIVGGTIRRSTERAAEWGDGWFAATNYQLDHVARQIRNYHQSLASRGKTPDQGMVMVNRYTVVADTEREAREIARQWVGRGLHHYARMGGLGNDPALSTMEPADLFEHSDQRWCLVGTPEQVAERVRRYAELGVTHLQLRVIPQELPIELAARSVELFGAQVAPAVNGRS